MRGFDFGRAVLASNIRMLKRPYRVNFCITYECQSRCKMCNIWDMHPEGELSLGEIEAFAEKNPGFSWVQLTGGEPTIRKDLPQIAAAFERTSRPYILTSQTNSLTRPGRITEMVYEMASLSVPHFVYTLSLDGPREVHDYQRGVTGNFDKVMEVYSGLRHLLDSRKGFRVIFGYTMTSMNAGRLEETVRAVKKVYPEVSEDDFHLNMAQASGHYYGNEGGGFAPDRRDAAEEIRRSIERRKFPGLTGWAEKKFLLGLMEFARTGVPPLKTRELESSLYLDSYGDVYPSIMWGLKLGSIRATGYDLKPIWEGPEMAKAKAALARGESPKHWTSCEAYQSIMGGVLR